MNAEASITWAQCDSCSKWRKLPSDFPLDQLPNDWVCSMNPNKKFSSCDVPEEAYNESDRIIADNNNNIANHPNPTVNSNTLHCIYSNNIFNSNDTNNNIKINANDAFNTNNNTSDTIEKSLSEYPAKSTDLLVNNLSTESSKSTVKNSGDLMHNMQISSILLQTSNVEIPPLDANEFNYYNFENQLIKTENIELPTLPNNTANALDNNPKEHDVNLDHNTYNKVLNSFNNINMLLNDDKIYNYGTSNIYNNNKAFYDNSKPYARSSNNNNKEYIKSYENNYRKRHGNNGNAHKNSEKYENEMHNSYSGRIIKPSRYDDYVKTETKYQQTASNNNFNFRNRKVKKSHAAKKAKKEVLPLSLVNWVQCEGCKKWRQLPSHVNVEVLPDNWYCKMNIWDPQKADCSVPEEPEPLPGSSDSNFPSSNLSSTNISQHPKQKGKGNKVKKNESLIHNEFINDYSDIHYIDCPVKDSVAGHPVGDRLVVYSDSHTSMSVSKTPSNVAVFSKYSTDANLDKKRASSDPLVLSFGCKTDWNLESVDAIVSERQIDNEQKKLEKDMVNFVNNGLEGGLNKLLQLCPNLRGQVCKRTIIPSECPDISLLTNISCMRNDQKTVVRRVDNNEAFEMLSAWKKNNKSLIFAPDSRYANMLLCSAVEHV